METGENRTLLSPECGPMLLETQAILDMSCIIQDGHSNYCTRSILMHSQGKTGLLRKLIQIADVTVGGDINGIHLTRVGVVNVARDNAEVVK